MNYNEYDSNGNRKKFNFSDIINDRTQRSRFFLFIYLIIFIILVIMIRFNLSSTAQNNEEINNQEENNNSSIVEEKENDEIKDMFSFIDLKNYVFIYEVDIDSVKRIIDGKRFNNKYSFTMKENDKSLYFIGTSNYIRAKESLDGELKLTGLPYVLINYFDTDILKDLIINSTLVEDKYEITNEKISSVINTKINDKEKVNKIELVKNNNKITQIKLDLSNAIGSYIGKEVEAYIVLKFGNFGLIDDFSID